jgi:signal transduction histidine kinase
MLYNRLTSFLGVFSPDSRSWGLKPIPMAKLASRFQPFVERALPWAVLAVLLVFTYAFFLRVPYAGFIWDSSDGRIFEIYVPTTPEADLRVGDRLTHIGSTALDDFRSNLRQTLFEGIQPGQVVSLHIQRGEGAEQASLIISWVFPGFNLNQALARLISDWWLAYAFWVAGTVTLFFFRPKDTRWRLLIAFNFLTALWLAAGSGVSRWHIWESAIVLRSVVWLCLPVYLHLHWVFPKPLGRLPAFVLWGLYVIATILAVAEWFLLLPPSAYYLGFLVAVVGSALLFGAHFILRPEQRQDIRLLAAIGLLAFVPSIAVGIATTFSHLPPSFAGGFLVFLAALPFGYLYVVSRRRLGELELRVNRLISLYLFLGLLSLVFITLVTLVSFAESRLGFFAAINLISLAAAVITLVAIVSFGPFQRFVERRVLGAPWPLEQLLETYAARITTSLDDVQLVRLLTKDVLPTLLVRQSALLRYDENRLGSVYRQNVEPHQLPTEADLPALLAQAGRYRAPVEDGSLACPWARLILPLSLGPDLVGLWLLGRRDPDDFYAQAEITTLQALAHQTAIALTNIVYAGRLHALYQLSIDQREAERASLGRDLHDHILQQLFVLHKSAAASLDSPPFVEAYETVIHDLRNLIRGLRPPMLEYGLYRALAALADDWTYRSVHQSGLHISLAVAETDVRYVPHVELHLYRIVQQAGENALRHAQARNLRIHGCLEAEKVDLTIEDDGQGFEVDKMLDLSRPEARSHFGLIGMRERAALINAQIKFDSAPGRGTRVHLTWRPEN